MGSLLQFGREHFSGGSQYKDSPTLGSLLGLPPFMETIIARFVESQYYESCDVVRVPIYFPQVGSSSLGQVSYEDSYKM